VNIDKMPAGREIDIMVAESVMQLSVCRCLGVPRVCGMDMDVCMDCGRQLCPCYSLHIVEAWKVARKLKWWKAETDLGEDGSVAWHFRQGTPPRHKWFAAQADLAPLAICRAALKLVNEMGMSFTNDNS